MKFKSWSESLEEYPEFPAEDKFDRRGAAFYRTRAATELEIATASGRESQVDDITEFPLP
jgi:hypothetical protein